MRQSHVAGEKMFVDYAGATLEVIDGLTGEVRAAQIFVATLGASSYTYAEATWTQALPNWIGSHTIASNRSFRPWNRPVDGCGRCAQPADLLPRWTFTVSPITIAMPSGGASTPSLTITLRRAAHDLETKRCLCGTWKNTILCQKKKIPANLLE